MRTRVLTRAAVCLRARLVTASSASHGELRQSRRAPARLVTANIPARRWLRLDPREPRLQPGAGTTPAIYAQLISATVGFLQHLPASYTRAATLAGKRQTRQSKPADEIHRRI